MLKQALPSEATDAKSLRACAGMCAQGVCAVSVGPRSADLAITDLHGLLRRCHGSHCPGRAKLPESCRAEGPAIPHPDPG